MTLEELGFHSVFAQYREEEGLTGLQAGRVIAEHKERYQILSEEGEFEGEVIGNLRFTASGRADFPAVGDWVACSPYDEGKVLIHRIYPRQSLISRQAVGRKGETQIIAANIDAAFIVQAVDRDFNLNRIERYLTLCYESAVKPLIVLSKTDLISKEECDRLVAQLRERAEKVDVLPLSNLTGSGLEALKALLEKGKTYCLLGSSGVGKSSLLNSLSGEEKMKTRNLSESTLKGRHSTTHRELIVLPGGGLLIDNPGMREVGMTDAGGGLEKTFDLISSLAAECRFQDCTHTGEEGCAVRQAVEEGELEEEVLENYLRMQREKAHFEATVAERRKKDKDFGKMVREFKRLKSKDR